MRTVEARPTRAPLALWDVENVEAHVRAILHAGLGRRGARLNGQQTESALKYLDSKCWELSGLRRPGNPTRLVRRMLKLERELWWVPEQTAEPKTVQLEQLAELRAAYEHELRFVYVIRGFYKPLSERDPFAPIKAPEFGSEASAQIALERITATRPVAFARVDRQRPAGAFDPTRGLSFSTYSHRILIRRIWDWYRSDPEFGDTRYSSGRSIESLEGLGERMQREKDAAGEEWIDRNGPGARLEFIDDLNRHAYCDPIEEVLTREAVRC